MRNCEKSSFESVEKKIHTLATLNPLTGEMNDADRAMPTSLPNGIHGLVCPVDGH